jgi:hypothetical protein
MVCGKVEVPLVGRHIRAFGQVAQVAQIALVDDFPVVFFVHAIHLECGAFVDQIEQGGKRAAQAHAAAATVANVEDALHLCEAGFFVIELGIEPIERVACGGFQAAFAGHGVFLKKRGAGQEAPNALLSMLRKDQSTNSANALA